MYKDIGKKLAQDLEIGDLFTTEERYHVYKVLNVENNTASAVYRLYASDNPFNDKDTIHLYILYAKELFFMLEEIKTISNKPSYNRLKFL